MGVGPDLLMVGTQRNSIWVINGNGGVGGVGKCLGVD